MKNNLQRFGFEIAFVVLLIAGFGTYKGYKHTSYFPYADRQLHGHRWRSEVCTANHVDASQCLLAIQTPNESPAYFDVCLEHGEFRRVK